MKNLARSKGSLVNLSYVPMVLCRSNYCPRRGSVGWMPTLVPLNKSTPTFHLASCCGEMATNGFNHRRVGNIRKIWKIWIYYILEETIGKKAYRAFLLEKEGKKKKKTVTLLELGYR